MKITIQNLKIHRTSINEQMKLFLNNTQIKLNILQLYQEVITVELQHILERMRRFG